MRMLFALLAAAGLGVVAGCDSPKMEKAKEEAKEAAHDTAEAGKEAAHDMAKEGEEAAHDAAESVKEGAEKIEEKTR